MCSGYITCREKIPFFINTCDEQEQGLLLMHTGGSTASGSYVANVMSG